MHRGLRLTLDKLYDTTNVMWRLRERASHLAYPHGTIEDRQRYSKTGSERGGGVSTKESTKYAFLDQFCTYDIIFLPLES